jgi:hypothetical protein
MTKNKIKLLGTLLPNQPKSYDSLGFALMKTYPPIITIDIG